ncbi:hypothetical protein F5148DRAFT_1220797 [Russula earlei]|uniref:Uncharacterized protein n=1 Tax=Russula earlei TaxID=71964 RepID=A0ACC0U299_9AGAM|nr:hypothetical protein F5148DRAFT_1220797 [Russula earlei]
MVLLLWPEFSRFITPGLETEVYQVIKRLIAMIGSPQIAIDERHTPRLYSCFLPYWRNINAMARPKDQMQTSLNMPRYQQPPQPPQQ